MGGAEDSSNSTTTKLQNASDPWSADTQKRDETLDHAFFSHRLPVKLNHRQLAIEEHAVNEPFVMQVSFTIFSYLKEAIRNLVNLRGDKHRRE